MADAVRANLFLTPDQVREMTGYVQPAAQIDVQTLTAGDEE